jgi:integrase
VAKRGNGEGSKPRQRADGRWEARYCVDTPEGLKRRSVYGKTRKEVAEKLAGKLANKDDERIQPIQNGITVREFFGEYEEAIRHTIKRRSFQTTHDVVRLHILPEFGTMRLTNLDRKHIQRMYTRKQDDGLSPATVKRMHDVLASALNHAVRWRYIQRNPCDEVSKPRVPQPEIRPFSLEEAKRFIAAAEGDRYEALFILGLTSGARWGELTGLFWSDLDLERRVMHIQRALVNGYGGHTFDTPKTNGSSRSVGLTVKATEALLRHRERILEEGYKVYTTPLMETTRQRVYAVEPGILCIHQALQAHKYRITKPNTQPAAIA